MQEPYVVGGIVPTESISVIAEAIVATAIMPEAQPALLAAKHLGALSSSATESGSVGGTVFSPSLIQTINPNTIRGSHPGTAAVRRATPEESASIRESLKQHGFDFTRPVVLSKSMLVMDGRERVELSEQLHIDVGYVISDAEGDLEERAAILRLHLVAGTGKRLSELDRTLLACELQKCLADINRRGRGQAGGVAKAIQTCGAIASRRSAPPSTRKKKDSRKDAAKVVGASTRQMRYWQFCKNYEDTHPAAPRRLKAVGGDSKALNALKKQYELAIATEKTEDLRNRSQSLPPNPAVQFASTAKEALRRYEPGMLRAVFLDCEQYDDVLPLVGSAITDHGYAVLLARPEMVGLKGKLHAAAFQVRELVLDHDAPASLTPGSSHEHVLLCTKRKLEVLKPIKDIIGIRNLSDVVRAVSDPDDTVLFFGGEVPYLSFSRSGAELLFQVFADRYERGSILITSNLPFGEWGQVFQGERMTAALLDRFTHRCHIFEMNGESYRFRESSKQAKEKKATKETK